MPIDKSIQYRCITENRRIYSKYVHTFRGTGLTDHYSLKQYCQMIDGFEYLAAPYENSYILVKRHQKLKGQYDLLDGLHRAAMLVHQGNKNALVAEIE